MELDALHLPKPTYGLFRSRRFLPMFLAAFLGTFNDNLVRSGIVVMIAYAAVHGVELPARPEILVTICSGLLVLPMVLFSSVAGQLADKYEKSQLMRFTKIAEVFIMVGVFYGFTTQNIPLLMVLLFLSGVHTTFYLPIKFSILPQHLREHELLAGNGFMASGSYLAILGGMIAGGLLVEEVSYVIGSVAIVIALVGLVASMFIPLAPSAHPHGKVNLNLWRGTMEIIGYALRDKMLARVILVLSWFILVGSVFISQFANYAQGVVHADNQVYIIFLTIFSCGIALGSLLCDKILKGEVSGRFTSYAALGMSFFITMMVATTPAVSHEGLMTAREFLAAPQHLWVLGAMFMIAVCGGIYMVPLYAMLQHRSAPEFRSRIIAVSNVSDSLLMTLAATASAVLLYAGASVMHLFMLVAIINLAVAWYARKLT